MRLALLDVFFFQAEDGIRDDLVTGVQTCALPIYVTDGRTLARQNHTIAAQQPLLLQVLPCEGPAVSHVSADSTRSRIRSATSRLGRKIGRASCRERVERWVGRGAE